MYTWFGKYFGSFFEVIRLLHNPTEATRLRIGANREHPNFPQLV